MMEKKKKKIKYQPLDFNVEVVKSSWADDDSASFGDMNINAIREKLPSAPKAVRNAYDVSQLPANGPWKARVNNLPFNVREDDVVKFLGGDDVQDIEIPYNGNRMKGYAIATFVNRDALANALAKNDDQLMNRRISVNLLTDDGHGSYGDSGNAWGRRDDSRRPIRDDDDSDWRSIAIQSREETLGRQERSSPANGDWTRGPSRRPWQDEESRSSRRFEGRGGFDRFEGERDSGPRRDWNRDSDRSDTRERRSNYERDNRDRSGDYQSEGRDRREGRTEGPRERPRLNLQPRSKPLEVTTSNENGKDSSRSSIFGDARPVDTASKEREIESRMERDRNVVPEHRQRRLLGSQSSLTEKEDVSSGQSQRNIRSRKTSDSSGHGKSRSSATNSPGYSVRPGSDSEPTSPPVRTAAEPANEVVSSTSRRQQKIQGGNDEEEGDPRNRRSSTTSGDSGQPTVQVIDAPPPTVNVWQVRRSQMQKRAEAAAAAASSEPDSTARASTGVNNSNATPMAAPVVSQSAPAVVANEDPFADEESSSVKQLTPAAEEHSSANPSGDVSLEPEDGGEKGERTSATAPQSHPVKRPPVVVSVSAAQRAAAEGQPPPPPLHINTWQQNTQGGIDSSRQPPSPPQRGGSGNQSNYERSYQYPSHHSHSGHNDWQDGGPRGSRNDYRDGPSNFRGSGYGGGRGNRGGWRGRGGSRSYRSRGRGYRYGGGGLSGEPSSADM